MDCSFLDSAFYPPAGKLKFSRWRATENIIIRLRWSRRERGLKRERKRLDKEGGKRQRGLSRVRGRRELLFLELLFLFLSFLLHSRSREAIINFELLILLPPCLIFPIFAPDWCTYKPYLYLIWWTKCWWTVSGFIILTSMRAVSWVKEREGGRRTVRTHSVWRRSGTKSWRALLESWAP